MWALEIEPGSSGKAASAFNRGAISLALFFKFLKRHFILLCVGYVYLWVSTETVRYLIPCAIAGGCELPDMGAGNQILLLRKSSKHL